MATNVPSSVASTRSTVLSFICPRCRAPLDLEHGASRCASCDFEILRAAGIISFVAQSNPDEWRGYWEEKASGPDGNTSTGVAYNFSLQHRYMVDGFRALCGDPAASARILDIGCGNGLFWRALFGNRAVVGVDFSVGMCSLARARGMEVYHADARALPFADAQFDLLYCAEILQYIDDLPGLLTEFARVCRPGGHVVVSTLNRNSLLRQSVQLLNRFLPHDNNAVSSNMIRASLDEILISSGEISLRFGSVCWTHFPIPLQYRSNKRRYPFECFASNVIVEFTKSN